MRLLLDTAVLIFGVESPERLTKRATTLLQNTENILELSAISLSEIAIKAARGKLRLSAADTHRALEELDLRILPYTAHHAFYLFDLPPHHADPFDRQIIAQALCEKIPVVTCDENFSWYKDTQSTLVVLSVSSDADWWTLPFRPGPHEPPLVSIDKVRGELPDTYAIEIWHWQEAVALKPAKDPEPQNAATTCWVRAVGSGHRNTSQRTTFSFVAHACS